MIMIDTDTITAPATPLGKSALAVLRVSGKDAFGITEKCIKEINLFRKTPARAIQLYLAKKPATEKTIDQITAIKYSSPRSFTGENMVEIICHGGPRIAQKIMDSLLSAGARSAQRGEFTRRALENGKIDLMKAEAIRGLIDSNSEVDLQCAQNLCFGEETAHTLKQWKEELLEIYSVVEATIEFDNEDTGITQLWQEGKEKTDNFINKITRDLKRRERIKSIENGLKIVIAGPPNAGKSTLFNTLLGYNRAIVHSEPGTTRDAVSERLLINNHEVQLIDSAGIRTATSDVENEGILRSKEEIRKATNIIWVTAADEMLNEDELKELLSTIEKKPLCVINKIDIGNKSGSEKMVKIQERSIETIMVSLKKKENIDELISRITLRIDEIYQKIEIPDLLLNTRHEEIGRALSNEMVLARDAWEKPEIAAYHLKKCISFMDEFFGNINSEEMLNKIFDGFCIGK
jgi:tRNA modification GTPase